MIPSNIPIGSLVWCVTKNGIALEKIYGYTNDGKSIRTVSQWGKRRHATRAIKQLFAYDRKIDAMAYEVAMYQIKEEKKKNETV